MMMLNTNRVGRLNDTEDEAPAEMHPVTALDSSPASQIMSESVSTRPLCFDCLSGCMCVCLLSILNLVSGVGFAPTVREHNVAIGPTLVMC
jgi:hypothetical protein